jgi:hypothetical protein
MMFVYLAGTTHRNDSADNSHCVKSYERPDDQCPYHVGGKLVYLRHITRYLCVDCFEACPVCTKGGRSYV